jgi:hypothetical protein
VADFVGRSRLVAPAYDRSEHAWYLERDDAGPIEVTTLDALGLQLPAESRLVLKLDLEGGEFAAVRGAQQTLRAASRWLVLLEAHPLVARRTGIDPVSVLCELGGLRAINVELAEMPDAVLHGMGSFFSQFGNRTVNLIVEG